MRHRRNRVVRAGRVRRVTGRRFFFGDPGGVVWYSEPGDPEVSPIGVSESASYPPVAPTLIGVDPSDGKPDTVVYRVAFTDAHGNVTIPADTIQAGDTIRVGASYVVDLPWFGVLKS